MHSFFLFFSQTHQQLYAAKQLFWSLKPNYKASPQLDWRKFRPIFAPLQQFNPTLYNHIREIVQHGADIKRHTIPPPKVRSNPKCAPEIDLKITSKLTTYLKKGILLGPFKLDQLPYVIYTSPIYGNLKSSGKIRVIVNMSEDSGTGISINSEILEHYKRVTYTSFLTLITLINHIGTNGFIWTVDAQDAYWRIPVRDIFHHLFGVQWLNRVVVYTCLPFGLSTAPKIYNDFADGVEWSIVFHNSEFFIVNNIKYIHHYLDDFFGGHNSFSIANTQFQAVIRMMDLLGIPTSPKKCKPPSQQQTILGWFFDTVSLSISLPRTKQDQYFREVVRLLKRKRIKFSELKSICGKLRRASVVVFCGNAYVRGLEEAVCYCNRSNFKNFHHLRINKQMKYDLLMWSEFLSRNSTFSSISIPFLLKSPSAGDIHVWTDASGKGMGGFDSLGHWWQLSWQELTTAGGFVLPTIHWQELLAVTCTLHHFAKNYAGKCVTIHCDNATATTCIIHKRVTFESKFFHALSSLIKHVALVTFSHRFYHWAVPIPGKLNTKADRLSRFDSEPLLFSQPDADSMNIPFSLCASDLSTSAVLCSLLCKKR